MYKFCDAPYTSVSIHSNGNVYPCLCKVWQTKGSIGNLNEHSLEELFSSQWIEEFRGTIIDQSFRYCDKDHCGKIWNLDEIDSFDSIDKPTLPTNIFLQNLDLSCNLACPSCRLSHYYVKERNPAADFILDSLKKSYQDFDKPVYLTGDGEGEMLASQSYLHFLESPGLPKCFKICINSNGNLLTKRLDLVDKLGSQLCDINICFDASNQETYKKVRGGNLDLVKKGVQEVIARGVNVTAQFVVQKENYQEILEYRDMCLDLGIKFIGLQGIVRWPHMSDVWWEKNQIIDNPEIDYNWLIPALKEFKKTPDSGTNGVIETLIAQHTSKPVILDI